MLDGITSSTTKDLSGGQPGSDSSGTQLTQFSSTTICIMQFEKKSGMRLNLPMTGSFEPATGLPAYTFSSEIDTRSFASESIVLNFLPPKALVKFWNSCSDH